MDAFKIGDLVTNNPAPGIVVNGVVAEILSDGSPVIAANYGGEYVRFAANIKYTRIGW